MFQSIIDDLKQQLQWGNMVTRLIIVNVAVLVAVVFIRIGFNMFAEPPGPAFDNFLSYLRLSDNVIFSFTHPWVFFSYMFLHIGLWHIFMNMLFLYWFGRIVGDFVGDQRILPIYILGGLMAALVYLMAAPFLYENGSTLEGASGSIMAIVAVAGMIAPDLEMRLILLGNIKLKFIVLALIIIDLVFIASLENTGGHFAHIGGLIFGVLYVKLLHQGTDLAEPVNRFFDWLRDFFKEKPKKVTPRKSSKKSKVFVRYKAEKGQKAPSDSIEGQDHQSKLDLILDKISASGYDSLTQEEKDFLADASKK